VIRGADFGNLWSRYVLFAQHFASFFHIICCDLASRFKEVLGVDHNYVIHISLRIDHNDVIDSYFIDVIPQFIQNSFVYGLRMTQKFR